jgi:hypothetical protein
MRLRRVGADRWRPREKSPDYFALTMMDTPKPDAPLTVSSGTLTQAEYDRLTPDKQAIVEEGTRDLLARYGQAWLERERDRLRDELSFMVGVP